MNKYDDTINEGKILAPSLSLPLLTSNLMGVGCVMDDKIVNDNDCARMKCLHFTELGNFPNTSQQSTHNRHLCSYIMFSME